MYHYDDGVLMFGIPRKTRNPDLIDRPFMPLPDGSVTTPKIANGAVTFDKLDSALQAMISSHNDSPSSPSNSDSDSSCDNCPLELISGVTTEAEVTQAATDHRIMYFVDSNGKYHFITDVSGGLFRFISDSESNVSIYVRIEDGFVLISYLDLS